MCVCVCVGLGLDLVQLFWQVHVRLADGPTRQGHERAKNGSEAERGALLGKASQSVIAGLLGSADSSPSGAARRRGLPGSHPGPQQRGPFEMTL